MSIGNIKTLVYITTCIAEICIKTLHIVWIRIQIGTAIGHPYRYMYKTRNDTAQ